MIASMHIPAEVIQLLPKTDLHVHLDGSIRPTTVLDLMREEGLDPPAETPEELESLLTVGDRSLTLPEYLKFFDTTLKVLQHPESIERVAYELAVDAAAENVRHIEVRYSPILHQQQGLTLEEVMDAVLEGLRRAERDVDIHTGLIVCGIRQISPRNSLRLAELSVAYRDRGVVGFDLAGAEKDNAAKDHIQAFYKVLNANMNCTVHAGEAFGPASIHQAIHYCGAHRIGHGTRLREDPDLLAYVNNHRIPVEMCLTSNLHTGVVERIEDHPFKAYYDQGLRVTINTDNRLISKTTLSQEIHLATRLFGLTPIDLRNLLINGFKSAFIPFQEKVEMMKRVIPEMDALLARHFPESFDISRPML
jgi:adenosine deaminase